MTKLGKKRAMSLAQKMLESQDKLMAINIALRREDGKTECDTVYCKRMLNQEEVDSLAEKFKCDVLVSCVGFLTNFPEDVIKTNTLIKEVVRNGTSEGLEADVEEQCNKFLQFAESTQNRSI